MFALDRTMSFIKDCNEINREMVRAWARSADHLADGPSGLDKAFHGQLSAAEAAVEQTLRLERDCLKDLKRDRGGDDSSWSMPDSLLTAAESAIELRSRLWKSWFETVGKADLSRLGMFLPPLSAAASTNSASAAQDQEPVSAAGSSGARTPPKAASAPAAGKA